MSCRDINSGLRGILTGSLILGGTQNLVTKQCRARAAAEFSDLDKDFGKLTGVLGERIGGDAVALEHRDIEIAQRPFGLLLEEATVAQAHVRAPSENGRIVARVVSGAGAAPEQRHGVVEEPRLTVTDRGEPIQKIRELLGKKTVIV